MAKRCVGLRPRAKVTIDSLLEVVYKESIGTKMNDLDLCLEVVRGHVNHWVTFASKYLVNRYRYSIGSKKPSIVNGL